MFHAEAQLGAAPSRGSVAIVVGNKVETKDKEKTWKVGDNCPVQNAPALSDRLKKHCDLHRVFSGIVIGQSRHGITQIRCHPSIPRTP